MIITLTTAVSCHRKAAPHYTPIAKAAFPQSWLGQWSGVLEIHKVAGNPQEVPMQLTIAATESTDLYDWRIQYGEESSADERSYQLKVVDTASGHYQVDEKNTIVIDGYLFHNTFVTAYEVMGNTIDISYEYLGDRLHFDLVMYAAEQRTVTGDSLYLGEEIPAVQCYPVKVMQKAVLQRTASVSE